jgi:uncharacterized protein YgiM (DUF1202 family)
MHLFRTALLCALVLAFISVTANAQTTPTATVSRNAILRTGPSASSGSVSHVPFGTKLTLLAPHPTANYYRVRTALGDEGWIWSHNIKIDADTALPMSTSSTACDQTLWDHVYHGQMPLAKDRLVTITPCIAVSGTIMSAAPEKDGDYHIRLELDSAFQHLINSYNTSGQHGYLVVEPMCTHKVTQSDTLMEGVCDGFTQTIFKPAMKGKHVVVTGVYVTDAEHGWNEIHPVTSIEVK